MPEACVTGRCTKDGKQCPVCGGEVPPSLGVKPRKFCSKKCLQKHFCHRKQGPSSCADCGSSITQPPGKGRKRVVCNPCYLNRKRTSRVAVCLSCGTQFRASSESAMFCSPKCRWPVRPGFATCAACGTAFRQRHARQKCCSRECGGVAGARSRQPRRHVYQCLHCGSPFYRRPYRTANKYCSRQCAFDAKSVAADGDAFDMLAMWFANWGLDSAAPINGKATASTSHKARCRKFGVPYEPISRAEVFSRARWMCAICGCQMLKRHTVIAGKLDPRSPTIDCIVPLSAGPGGPGYVLGNVQACCHACNVRKSNSFAPHNAT